MQIKNLNDVKSLFLDNKTVKQTILKNTFWLTAGTVISRLLKLVLIIYVARILGATEYGKFTFALAFVSLFIIFSDLGLPTIITREFAREKKNEKEFYSILSLKILLSIGTLILILIGSFLITPEPIIRKLIWILAFFVLIDSFYSIINGFFNAHQRMEYVALGVIFNALIIVGFGLLVIFNFPSIINLSYAYLFGTIITLIFILIIFHLKFLPFKIQWKKKVWRNFLSMSWPLALAGLFSIFYNNIDSVMMGHLGQITETGWYNAAYRIIKVTFLPMGLISGSFFPVLSKFAIPVENVIPEKIEELKKNLQKVWNYNLRIMILLAVPIVVGGIILAPKIIKVIFGQDFLPSILAFQILIIMAGVCIIYRPFYDVLIASNQQRKIFWIVISGAVINIILNLILIPKYSLYGAAAATVITHFLIFFLLFRFTLKYTLVEPLNLKFIFWLITASFSSLIMYLAISQPRIYNLNVFFSIFIGAVVYIISLFFFKKIFNIFKII